MELDDRQTNGHARVVRPEGRLDMASAPALRHQMRQLMDSGVAKLVLDLSGVSFVDSSGLGAIISGLKLARQAGGDLRIACANQQVLVVLDLTSLNQVLQPFPTVEAALTDRCFHIWPKYPGSCAGRPTSGQPQSPAKPKYSPAATTRFLSSNTRPATITVSG